MVWYGSGSEVGYGSEGKDVDDEGSEESRELAITATGVFFSCRATLKKESYFQYQETIA